MEKVLEMKKIKWIYIYHPQNVVIIDFPILRDHISNIKLSKKYNTYVRLYVHSNYIYEHVHKKDFPLKIYPLKLHYLFDHWNDFIRLSLRAIFC